MSESRARKAWGPLDEVFAAGRPLSYVRSADEGRVVEPAAGCRGRGVRGAGAAVDLEPPPRACGATAPTSRASRWEPREALDFVARHDGPGAVPPEGLPRAHPRLGGDPPPAARPLRGVRRHAASSSSCASPVRELPDELAHNIVLIDLPVPEPRRADRLRPPRGRGGRRGRRHGRHERPGTLHQLARAAPGPHPRRGAPRHASRPLGSATRSTPSRSRRCSKRSERWSNRTGIIEFIPSVSGIEDIGGARAS